MPLVKHDLTDPVVRVQSTLDKRDGLGSKQIVPLIADSCRSKSAYLRSFVRSFELLSNLVKC